MPIQTWIASGISMLVMGASSLFGSHVKPLPPVPAPQPAELTTIPTPVTTGPTITDLIKTSLAPLTTSTPPVVKKKVVSTTVATSSPKTPAPKPEKPRVATSTPAATSSKSPSQEPTVSPLPAPNAAPTGLSSAIVNIICISKDSSVRSISGSGVFIDSRGLILTVAHVGQMFLLKDYPTSDTVSCTIRTGSPARNTYTAKLVYISGRWIQMHPDTLVKKAPTESGEDDFAVLAVTGTTNGNPLPSSFPAISLSTNEITTGEAATIGAYPAQDLTSTEVKKYLYQTIVDTSVKARYTFQTTTVDVISLGGSDAAQSGSSGGAVINSAGKLIGLITTSTTAGALAARDLHAITPGHIRRSFMADTGSDFDSYFTKNTQSLIDSFAKRSISLASLLENALN